MSFRRQTRATDEHELGLLLLGQPPGHGQPDSAEPSGDEVNTTLLERTSVYKRIRGKLRHLRHVPRAVAIGNFDVVGVRVQFALKSVE